MTKTQLLELLDASTVELDFVDRVRLEATLSIAGALDEVRDELARLANLIEARTPAAPAFTRADIELAAIAETLDLLRTRYLPPDVLELLKTLARRAKAAAGADLS